LPAGEQVESRWYRFDYEAGDSIETPEKQRVERQLAEDDLATVG